MNRLLRKEVKKLINAENLTGDTSRIWGDASGICGDISGIEGDLDM